VTEFLSIDDALHVAQRLGFHVRDLGLLASALARPEASMLGVDAYRSIEAKAAALLESLCRNHSMIDGNKRLAWTLTVAFLWINGRRVTFTVEEAFALVVGVADGTVPLEDSRQAFARHVAARNEPDAAR
jgi:death-on-curing protein